MRDSMTVLDSLTDKQREVLTLVADGLTSKEIARKLSVSESAVNQRIETIRQRLGGLPRSQIARLHRQQNTVVMTIPTSNSFTGNPIAVQSRGDLGQAREVEGVADHVSPGAMQSGDVLQPSTIFQSFEHALAGPRGMVLRVAAIIALAAGMATTALITLSVIETLDTLFLR